MTGATSAGSLYLTLQTQWDPNLLAPSTLTLAVSGITGTEGTQQLAGIVNTQLQTFLYQNNAAFLNVPPNNPNSTIPPQLTFPDQIKNILYNVAGCEHVVSIGGQLDFTLSINSTGCGSQTVVDSHPVLVDLQTAKDEAAIWGVVWEDYYGNDLTDQQIIDKISDASARLCAHMNNNIVPSTYIHYETGNGMKDIYLCKYPILDFFPPVIRRPIIFAVQQVTSNATVKQNYIPERGSGWLRYRFAQDFVDNVEPWDNGNECMIAYIGGYWRIPRVIKSYVVKLSKLVHSDEFKSVRGEGTDANYKSTVETLSSWANFLYEYFRGYDI